MKKALIVATVQSHIYHFHRTFIGMLHRYGYEVHIAARDDISEKNGLKLDFADEVFDIPFERSPLKLANITAYKQIKKLINNGGYDVIHCNTPMGGITSRLAARRARKNGTKVIYTAHGFHFFKGAPIVNWLVYYPVEKVCSYFTDVLITINKEDYELAKRKMKAKRVEYVPGVGIDTEKFANTFVHREAKRTELGITCDNIMLLSVGELNKNKNHEVIIKALARLNDKNTHYFIAGSGPLKDYLIELSQQLGLKDNVHLLGFRSDVVELCKSADVFCFPSKREGLPVSVMEAMSCGLPIIASKIRGNTDLIDGTNGILVKCNDESGLFDAIELLTSNPELASRFGQNSTSKVTQFDKEKVIQRMKEIYELTQE